MRPTVLLFDIDGTLLTTGGVGRRALQLAFERRYGRPDATMFPLDGMTDRRIARMGLEAIGESTSEAAIDEILNLYLDVLEEQVKLADPARYKLHVGMNEAIAHARERGMGIGLGTGNIREGARIKLQRVGVFDSFAFGGFGSDAEERVEIIRHGAERGARHVGAPLAECRVVVIGDTPKDIAAAKGIGAECIGVGTGSFTAESLLASGATHAFHSLSEVGALEAMVGE
jgi:phosphoglycolate phosphatase-like HAD superfamily hydrolase